MRFSVKIRRLPVLLIALGMGIVFLFEFLGFFEGPNHYVYDLSLRLRGSKDPGSTIIVTGIDEKTLAALGRWPIQRRHYAQLIAAVDQARVIGFDIVFSEASPDDRLLGDAMKRYGRAVLPVYVNGSLKRVEPVASLPSSEVGHVHVDRDIDGVTRRVFHNLYFGKEPLPSLSSVLYGLSTGGLRSNEPERGGRRNEMARPGTFVQADPMWINYYGPPGTFLHLSFADVLSGQYKPEFFKDRIVLVGVTAVGIEPEVLTPFSETRKGMSGVEVQANIVANLINGDSIKVAADGLTRLLSLLGSILCFFIFIGTSEKKSVLLWLISLTGVLVLSFSLLAAKNVWFPPVLLCIALTYAFGSGYIMRLNEAAQRLDQEYSKALASLRWAPEDKEKLSTRMGFLSLFSSGDLNNRVKTLDRIMEQLLFEKNLVDATLSSSVYGIILFDGKGQLAIANDRAKEFFANVERDSIGGFDEFVASLLPHVVDHDKPRDPAHLRRQTEEGTITFTVSLVNSDPAFLKMDVGRVLIDGKQYHLFVFSDVTKMKELETRKSEAVSIVSHELKQPLQVILGYSELISMGLARRTDEYARRIIQEAERMSKLIATFLGIARLESGKQTLSKTDFGLPQLFAEVVGLIKPIAEKKGITISSEVQSDCTTACMDREVLVQCLLNLLENAVKYSPTNREVRLQLQEEENLLKIIIKDYGYGLNEEEIPRIFDKFYRVKSEETKDVAGSGLGLTFVKEAITAMGGSISVESRPGEGSTFTLTFSKEAIRSRIDV